MAWFIVLGLIGLGLGLILLEFIFIPGTTVVGFIGLACAGYGIYLGYESFGSTVGTVILCISGSITLGGLYFSLKSGAWEKLSLKGTIKSKVNEDESLPIVGDIGTTTSVLRPSGSVDFDGAIREVHTLSGFVESRQKVRVIKVEGRKIWVEEAKEFL